MLSLVEQIRTGALWDFPGGIHPPENKIQSSRHNITRAALPSELVLPLKQHIGRPGTLIASVGDKVLKGQPLTKFDAGFTLPVHAPTSGTITAIEPRTVAHPSGLSEMAIVIQPDGEDRWTELSPIADFHQVTPDELIEVIRQAGVSGMGGATFPTARKLQTGLSRTEILIINAAECEPYITADDRLMQEHADEVIEGISILEHILQPKLTIIGIEDNKPQAVAALEKAAQHKDMVIRVVPSKYPSGGEKQLIKVLTNQEVPANGLPADIGILVQNVGSTYAIKRAVVDGEPLIERVVTLTGQAFPRPQNVWVRLGTPIAELLNQYNFKRAKRDPRVILGGPMMGFTLPHENVPITKGTNCILAPKKREIPHQGSEMACIRCGQCAEACPASLLPQQLVWYAKAQDYDKCEQLNLKDCIECGACAYVCPSEIPLVQYYRQAKAEIKERKADAESAERAKQRFEDKKARLERDKAERENRFKKAAQDRRQEMKTSGDSDAIAAAIARVKAQKSAQTGADEPAKTKPAVAAAIARAKAKQAQAAGQAEPDNSEMIKLREERKRQAREARAAKAESDSPAQAKDESKSDAVAAAIARAKARKAEQQAQPVADEATTSPTEDPKKAAVAEAIARAKARKAEQQTQSDDAVTTSPSEDPKKAAVAAAVARAKARKAEQQTQSDDEATTSPTEDPKKAAVAAAVARAKARKAEQQAQSDDEAITSPTEDPKKAAVAAAVARAKARKAEQQAQTADEATTSPTEDPKKAAVAAAVARAKARKAEQQAQTADEATTSPTEDPKKAAVAAAVARAKARKAEQQVQSADDTTAPPAEDPKKAAVAAAIARAKARKAQQANNQNEDQE
ncbi:electron transport complex subunit RsxC [Vibrio sp. WXL210]|uniref:electron transport complex subunit RsxC n=1 Tax=Vibrio sp. WXL210 TaxID=3450709 RepID=UPI003EC6E6FE